MNKQQWTIVGIVIVVALIQVSFDKQTQDFFQGRSKLTDPKNTQGSVWDYFTPAGKRALYFLLGSLALVWIADFAPTEATVFALLLLFGVMLNQGKPLTQGLSHFITTVLPQGK